MADYIPKGDEDFDVFQASFTTYAAANSAALGLTAGNVTSLTGAQSSWEGALTSHAAARNAAAAARITKDEARKAMTALIRTYGRKIQSNQNVTDAQRVALGLRVRDNTKTRSPTPTTRPHVVPDTSQRLEITLSWFDEATPTRRGRPAGVLGAEIYVKVGGAEPTDESECVFLALSTASRYTAHFEGSQGNQTAHFLLRWVNTRGHRGPLSRTVSATITS